MALPAANDSWPHLCWALADSLPPLTVFDLWVLGESQMLLNSLIQQIFKPSSPHPTLWPGVLPTKECLCVCSSLRLPQDFYSIASATCECKHLVTQWGR